MKKFDKVLKLWKKDNNRVSIKLKRPLQDLLCTKADYFRRKQEILDVIESKKSPSEAWNPYAWEYSLRDERKYSANILPSFKGNRSVIETANPILHEKTPDNSSSKLVRFEDDPDLNMTKSKTQTSSVILQNKKWCINDSINKEIKMLQNSTFGKSKFEKQ